MDLRLWRAPRGGISISTPAGDVRIYRPGIYRIDVGASPEAGGYPPVEVTVLDGEADVPSPDGFSPVEAGSAAYIYAGYYPDVADAQEAAIDDWARDREAQEHWDRQAAFPSFVTGFEDLEDQGDFVDTADYGSVWFPRDVPADWAPYRYGHWAYVQPWGWTWIDDQPWGFAPFHYGRWAQFGRRWGWVPGRPTAEPVYAPALVAFVGGRGWSIGFGAGESAEAVGWVPLAPNEVYRPNYQVSSAYVRQVNAADARPAAIGEVTANAVANAAQYRNAPAATVVRLDAFARGASVQRSTAPVSLATLAHAPASSLAAPPTPTREPRTGVSGQPGGPSPRGAGPTAAPPPISLRAVRAAVAAQPAGSYKPPVIVGARISPPREKPVAGGATPFVAPAQVKSPDAQARRRIAPPVRPQTAPLGQTGAPQGLGPAEGRTPEFQPPRPTTIAPPAPPSPPMSGPPQPAVRRPPYRPPTPPAAPTYGGAQPPADELRLRQEQQRRAADAQALAARQAEAAREAQAAQQAQQRALDEARARAAAQAASAQSRRPQPDHPPLPAQPQAPDKALNKTGPDVRKHGAKGDDAGQRPPQ